MKLLDFCLVLLMLKNINTLEKRDEKAKVVFLEPPIDGCHLPMAMLVSVNTTTLSLNLRLKRNTELQGNTPVYVTRRNENGEMEIVRDVVPDTEVRGEYIDVENKASVEISCFMNTDNRSNFQMQGLVSSPDGTLYTVEPNSRWKRDTASQLIDYNYRIIPETPSLNAENYDDDGIVSPSKETQIGKSSWTIGHQRNKREIQPVYIDIVTLIEYSVFLRWFSRSTQATDLLKRTEALQNIMRHFSHVVNAIQLRFKTISSQYNIRLVGYVIEDEHHGDWFENVTTQEDHENKTVNGYRLLPSARDYVNNVIGFPENDHVMAFTAYDLYSIREGVQSKGLLGRAYVGTVCRIPLSSISIVEYRDRLVDDMLVASHELGHALNASHDGVGNLCSGADMFIMSSSYSSLHSLNHSNSYLFSNCSSRDITTYIEDLISTGSTYSQSCLLDYLSAASVTNISGEMPGQFYEPDTQCRMVYGEESYLCRNVVNSSSICKRMYCRNTEDSLCYSINAAQGTTCGNKKWCIAGECVYSDNAPQGNTTCLFGDTPGIVYQNQTCEEFIPPDRKDLCYNKGNVGTCCGSCLKYKTNITGCEYGDKNPTACDGGITSGNKHLCYDKGNSELCCGTCQKYETNEPGCEYGDRNPTVCEEGITTDNKSLCYHKGNAELCCGTCQKYETNEPGCEYGDNLWNTSCHVDQCLDRRETNYINICCDTCRNFSSPSSTVATPTSTSSTAAMSITPSSSSDNHFTVIRTESPDSSSLSSIDVLLTSSFTLILSDSSSIDPSRSFFTNLLSSSIQQDASSMDRILIDPSTGYFTDPIKSLILQGISSDTSLRLSSSVHQSSRYLSYSPSSSIPQYLTSTTSQSDRISIDLSTSYFTDPISSSILQGVSSDTSLRVSSSVDPSTTYLSYSPSPSITQYQTSTTSQSDRILIDPSTSYFTDPISSSILLELSSDTNLRVSSSVFPSKSYLPFSLSPSIPQYQQSTTSQSDRISIDPSTSCFTDPISSLILQGVSSDTNLRFSSSVDPSTSYLPYSLSSSIPQYQQSTTSQSDRISIDPSTSYFTDPISSSILLELSSDTSLRVSSSVDPSTSYLSYSLSPSIPQDPTSTTSQSDRISIDLSTSYFSDPISSSILQGVTSDKSLRVSSSVHPSTTYLSYSLSSSITQDLTSTTSLSDRILIDPSTSYFTDPISSLILSSTTNLVPYTAPVDPSTSDSPNLPSSLTPQDASFTTSLPVSSSVDPSASYLSFSLSPSVTQDTSSIASLPDSSTVIPSASYFSYLLFSSMPQDSTSTLSQPNTILIDQSTSYSTDPISSSMLQEISSDTSLSHRSFVDPSTSNLSHMFSSSSSINQSNRQATMTSYASYTSVSTTSPAGTATFQESSPSQAVTTRTPVTTTNTGGTGLNEPLRILIGMTVSVCGIAVLLSLIVVICCITSRRPRPISGAKSSIDYTKPFGR